MTRVVGVRFKNAGKVYTFDAGELELAPGDTVIVEVDKGIGMATVATGPEEVEPATLGRELKNVVREADEVDLEREEFNCEREEAAAAACRELIEKYNIPMKLVRVEYLFDSSKAIFHFTSENRVDFRRLVKELASRFYTRIEMRQIGVRDEAKLVGGIGPCGRELCCSTFLADFVPVTVKMAKEQNVTLNPLKISGVCGRLMCCLGYELDTTPRGGGKKARECGGCAPHGRPRSGTPETAGEAEAFGNRNPGTPSGCPSEGGPGSAPSAGAGERREKRRGRGRGKGRGRGRGRGKGKGKGGGGG